MGIARISRWYWLAASVVLGVAVAETRQWADELDLGGYGGRGINAQHRFEKALVDEQNGARLFKDVVVYPDTARDPGGGRRLVHVVCGKYLDPGAKLPPTWESAYYVAETPYRPLGVTAPADATVLNYLDGLSGTGVRYTYAWWWEPRWARWVWIGASVVVVGVVAPTVLSLLAFGTLNPPREAKGVSLLGVKGTSPAAEPALIPDAQVPVPEFAGEELVPELEPAAAVPAGQPVATLSQAAATAVAGPAGPAKEFGKDEEDFYPTELKARHRHGGPDAAGR